MPSYLKPSLACLIATALAAACTSPNPPTGDTPASATATATPAAGTRLTIHSDGYEALARSQRAAIGMPGHAQIERPLRIALKAGANEIAVDELPLAIDVEAAGLRAQDRAVAIVGQRYLAPPGGGEDVLAQAVGRKVTVEHTAGGAKQTDSGTLLAVDDGLTLALDDGGIKVVREYDSFNLADSEASIPRRATLQWNVEAPRQGDAEFVLSYPTGGLAWRAEYLATLAMAKDGACRLSLDGAAMIANRSGLNYDDARISLVAGDTHREQVQVTGNRMRGVYDRVESYAEVAQAAPAPVARIAGESHAYDLPGNVRLRNGSTERVPLFPARPEVACERSYVVETDGIGWEPPQPLIDAGFRGTTGIVPVITTVTIQNTKDAGLGQAMPAGRVRVFDGADLLGESMLAHTAAGAEIRLPVGKAFDLTAKREATSFRLDRAGRTITESFSIELRNAKPQPATLRVIEPLPRWSDWEIVASSVASKKKDARRVQFDVPVPANGQTTLTYTVRYRWPQDVKP